MDILHITPSYKPAFIYGGPTVSVSRLCESLQELNINNTVFTTTANGVSELDVERNKLINVDGVNVVYFKRITGDHSHFSPKLLLKLFIEIKKFDVIHIHSWWNLVSIPSVFICFMLGVRPILSTRGMLSNYTFKNNNSVIKTFFHRFFGKFLLKKTILHATSSIEARDGLKIFPSWQTFIAPNIINLPILTNYSPKKKSDILVLTFLGRVNDVKRLDSLLESLTNLKINYLLNICGDGDKIYVDKLKQFSTSNNINVIWHGWVGPDQKSKILKSSDFLILTSYSENFANVIIESLALGVPVLTTETVGLSEYIKEKDFGWILSQNHNTWAESITDAFSDLEKRNWITKNAPYAVLKDFNHLLIAKLYASFYKKLKKNTFSLHS